MSEENDEDTDLLMNDIVTVNYNELRRLIAQDLEDLELMYKKAYSFELEVYFCDHLVKRIESHMAELKFLLETYEPEQYNE